MPAVAVDTHAIVWYLSSDPQLPARAAGALDSATEAGEFIHVPSICLVEPTYLVEKGRLPAAARDLLIRALDDPATPCLLAPLDRAVAPHSRYSWMASLMHANVSSSVAPCDQQPGSPGRETLYPSSVCVKATGYFIPLNLAFRRAVVTSGGLGLPPLL